MLNPIPDTFVNLRMSEDEYGIIADIIMKLANELIQVNRWMDRLKYIC